MNLPKFVHVKLDEYVQTTHQADLVQVFSGNCAQPHNQRPETAEPDSISRKTDEADLQS